jgi:hypothetical protein
MMTNMKDTISNNHAVELAFLKDSIHLQMWDSSRPLESESAGWMVVQKQPMALSDL